MIVPWRLSFKSTRLKVTLLRLSVFGYEEEGERELEKRTNLIMPDWNKWNKTQ